jgi:hypothetical protein
MSQIGPDDAISNLATWYAKIAVPPEWLTYPALDTVWTFSFGLMAFLSLLAFFLPAHFFSDLPKPKHQKQEPKPAALSADAKAVLGITNKSRYAPPDDTKGLDIRTSTYKELGALFEAIGRDTQKFQRSLPYNASDEQIISQFHKKLAPHILWAYEEARRRGHHDSTLEAFYTDPAVLRVSGIEWIGKELIKLGARMTLYIDG